MSEIEWIGNPKKKLLKLFVQYVTFCVIFFFPFGVLPLVLRDRQRYEISVTEDAGTQVAEICLRQTNCLVEIWRLPPEAEQDRVTKCGEGCAAIVSVGYWLPVRSFFPTGLLSFMPEEWVDVPVPLRSELIK